MLEPSLTPPPDRLSWFNGDADALDLYLRVSSIAHAWDDLLDQDKPVDINALMANLLLYLPQNRCYQKLQREIHALFLVGMVAYMASNDMVRGSDQERELAHYLRYAVMHVGVFLIGATNPPQRAAEILRQAAPVMFPERLADYLQEHAHADR